MALFTEFSHEKLPKRYTKTIIFSYNFFRKVTGTDEFHKVMVHFILNYSWFGSKNGTELRKLSVV